MVPTPVARSWPSLVTGATALWAPSVVATTNSDLIQGWVGQHLIWTHQTTSRGLNMSILGTSSRQAISPVRGGGRNGIGR